eukprot:CAMPEP_0201560034 /NCGR_PEP_ID=MMETSP0173_2-20130828/77884_1 /ASSEMBLY_ACC=CAM_ASM_000268 /TAXON_ID=218659 /ORGANISM="Vexillifera sp., Strain DIVA3 564/2" /LENGTH=554 /DNA_ID=CAMNT_0047974451 /DNA_START=48 /DNA_END=1708 /DNA_ORIENTATION=+
MIHQSIQFLSKYISTISIFPCYHHSKKQLSTFRAKPELDLSASQNPEDTQIDSLLDDLAMQDSPPTLPTGVFTNGILKLSDIDVVGFDYDYTLACYTREMMPLIYRLAVDYLTDVLGYPRFLSDALRYDPSFPIRGLHYDLKHGHIMKLDYLLGIQKDAIYFGRQPVSERRVLECYGSYNLAHTYVEQSCRQMVDVFCLPEACLLADVIECFESREISYDPSYVFQDVRSAIEMVHRSGALHRAIVEDFAMYLRRTPLLVDFLVKLRLEGRKTFLLTNSPYPFVAAGMDFLTHELLPPGMSNWRELFDLVMTASRKPDFFVSDRPFRMVDMSDPNDPRDIDQDPQEIPGDNHKRKPSVYRNVAQARRAAGNKDIAVDPTNVRYLWEGVSELRSDRVYAEGSLRQLQKFTDWGDRVLYFGDHVLADLKEPVLASGWKTGVIISELEREIRIMNSQEYRSNLRRLVGTHHYLNSVQRAGKPYDEEAKLVNKKRIEAKRNLKRCFNSYFGSIHRTYRHPSMFSHLMLRFANIYTSKVENLIHYPPDFTFYPERFHLP